MFQVSNASSSGTPPHSRSSRKSGGTVQLPPEILARYPVGASTNAQVALSTVTPTPINDAVLARVTGIKRG